MPERPSAVAVFVRATRLRTVPLVLGPVVLGSAIAVGPVSWVRVALVALGVALAHLAVNALNDVADAASGADRIAGMDRTAIVTASGVIDAGVMTARSLTMLGITLAAGASVIAGVLAVLAGPAVVAFALTGGALGVFYTAPPLRLGYRGWGIGEVVIALAYGPLIVAGTAYVSDEVVRSDALWAGLVPGMLTMIAFFHANMLHHKADKAVGKRTLVAQLGAEAGLIVDGLLIMAAFVVMALQVAVELFPLPALAAVVLAVPMFAAWTRAFRDPNPQFVLGLLGTSLGSSVLVSTWLAVSLAAWGGP